MNINLKPDLWMIISGYALLNGFLYSQGFWGRFEVDIFQYVSFYDFLPSILYATAIAPILLIVILAFHLLLDSISDNFFNLLYRKGLIIESDLKTRQVIFNHISAVAACLIGLALIFNTSSLKDIKILACGMAFTLLIYFYTYHKTKYLEVAKEKRGVVLIILITIPYFSFITGTYNSSMIYNGNKSFIIKSEIPCRTDNNDKYRLIASTSTKAFALSVAGKDICIYDYEYLSLEHEKNPLPTALKISPK